MGTYNVSKIEGWLKDFTSAKDKFTNTYYSDYKNSYVRSCNDSAVTRMRNKLNQHYDRINRINKRIKDVWDDFLYDLKAIDNRLAGGKGSANDSAVASKLSKLPTLKEYSATLKTRINSSSAVVGTVDKIGWSEDRTALENIDYVLDRTEATITVAGTSVIEGIGKFGEGIMDACAPIVTEAYCWYHLTYTEGFTEETAEEARQNSRDFVAKEHVKSAFEDAYSESLRERAYGFDTIRSVGNEIGEVVPAAVISMIPGVGQVLGPAVYGVAKSGNHIEENFQDENNGYLESILKGYAEGVFDGLFFAAGMKGDAVMKSAAKEIVKEGGKATLKKGGILFAKTIYECGCSVAQDGSNILIDSIFLDGPVQASDGSVIQNPSFLDKLNYCFEQSGGMKGMATSMLTATVLSSVSDAVDLRGIKNVDTNTALKNVDINTSSTRKSMSNVNSKNIDITSKSNKSISGASKNATDINSNNVKKSVSDIKNKDINIKSKNKGNTFIGDKIGGSASDPDVLKKIDELRNSKAVNTSNSKNINVKPNNDVKINPLSKEYDDLLKKTKEPWFIQAKEARDNGWAWNLNEVSEVDNIVKRMGELEGNLGIKNTGIPESKIYDYSGAKKEADELARKISKEPIPGYENIDTNSPEYQKALKEYYSKPSPSGKQDLSQIENPFLKQADKVKTQNIDLNKNITSKTLNKNLSKMQSLPKTLAGVFASVPAALSKMKNVDITPNSKIFKKIQDQGLYHFTDEVSAKKILDSGYIKESSHFTSYGKKRTFMFAGVPSVEDTCLNSVFDYKKTAVKLHPSDAEIGNLQYRKYSDSAVSSIGNYDITNSSPEIAYLVLKEQDGALKYVEVPKVEYDNYNPHFNDNVINKTVENARKKLYQTTVGMSSEYDNVIKGVKQYSTDFKDKLYKMTKKSTNTNIDTKKLNVNKTNNSNGFKIVEDITGGAAADEQVLKQVDEILDINANNANDSNKTIKNINVKPRNNAAKYLDNLNVDDSKVGKQISLMAKEFDVSEKEMKKILDKKIVSFVDNSDIGIRISNENLYNVLKSGEIKNQFQTGTTSGAKMLDMRTWVEKELFNAPEDLADADRPIYGMLFPKGDKNYIVNGPNAETYGDVVCIFKKEKIINDTTLTCGDSLEYYNQLNAIEASNPEFTGAATKIFGFKDSLDEIKNSEFQDTFNRGLGYFEAQLHGNSSHSIDNIEKILFTSEPNKKLIKLLKKKKIDWEVVTL